MNNKKLYPFLRNHYFYGKLLTVRDFEEEQRYFNNKRRLNNLLLTGPGVVVGMDTVMVDEKSVSIEAGLAVDYQGREIIVPESVTLRLDILDGFDRLMDTGEVYLCIEYQEKATEEVHSAAGAMAGGEVSMDYNRVAEGYRLYLTEEAPKEEELSFRPLAAGSRVIFADGDVKITQQLPRYVNPGQEILIQIKIEKINVTLPVSIHYSLCSNAFSAGEPVLIRYEEDGEKAYSSAELTYPVRIRPDAVPGALSVTTEGGTVAVGSAVYPIPETASQTVQIVRHSPVVHILRNYRKLHMEELVGDRGETAIYLAAMRLIRREKVYYIEQLEALPFQQYVLNNAMLALLLEFYEGRDRGGAFYSRGEFTEQFSKQAGQQREFPLAHTTETAAASEEFQEQRLPEGGRKEETNRARKLQTASGETVIGTDLHSSGKSYFSDELVHGLGPGNVFLQAAIAEEKADGVLIFGEASVFAGSAYEPELPEYRLAIRSDPARGTFRIGIHFLGNIMAAHIRVKWQAYRIEERKELEYGGLSQIKVKIDPSTAKVSPGEKIKFNGWVEGGASQDISWSVTEPGGGWIDGEGWYEAPAGEGVFEITAESVRYPGKQAGAYIVVKKG